MKPTLELVHSLEAVGKSIKEGIFIDPQTKEKDFYSWDQPTNCNAGLLARQLGISKEEIKKYKIKNWYSDLKNMENNPIFYHLIDKGIYIDDIWSIEYCDGILLGILHNEDSIRYEEKVCELSSSWFKNKASNLKLLI